MRDNPQLDPHNIAACLHANYALEAQSIAFLPLGYDLNAAVYEVAAEDGAAYFLKLRTALPNAPSLAVAMALQERGVPNILAPLPTSSGALWCWLGERSGVLYPFIRGESAMDTGMRHEQWRAFGQTLRAVHDSGLEAPLHGQLPQETFALPSAAVVREVQASLAGATFASPAATRFASFWRDHSDQIAVILECAESLGRRLQTKPFERVLCHADIHAANILVGKDGRIHLVDWDWPIIAPRERDLLFIVGSRIARPVTPAEEAAFFAGYGPAAIDPEAIVYYRYELFVEDLGDVGLNVFRNPELSETMREDAAGLARGYFAPGGYLETVEIVSLLR